MLLPKGKGLFLRVGADLRDRNVTRKTILNEQTTIVTCKIDYGRSLITSRSK